jgi:hypothetical protein
LGVRKDRVVDFLEKEFQKAGQAHEPIDREEVYSKYEASAGMDAD